MTLTYLEKLAGGDFLRVAGNFETLAVQVNDR